MITLLENDWSPNEDSQDEEDACAICGGLKEDGLCTICEDKDEGLGGVNDEFDDDDNAKE